MPRTAITVQTLALTATTPTYATVDNASGNYFVHPGGTILIHVKNTNAATRTLTITTTAVKDGVAFTSPTYTIAATTGDSMICNLPAHLQTAGQVYLDWSASTNTTVAVFSIPG